MLSTTECEKQYFMRPSGPKYCFIIKSSHKQRTICLRYYRLFSFNFTPMRCSFAFDFIFYKHLGVITYCTKTGNCFGGTLFIWNSTLYFIISEECQIEKFISGATTVAVERNYFFFVQFWNKTVLTKYSCFP